MDDRAFKAAKHVLCCLSKDKDIPEVEAVIRLLLPALEAHWQRIVDEALADVNIQLNALADELRTPSVDALSSMPRAKRDRLLQDLLLALLASLRVRMGQPLSVGTSSIVRASVASLLADGARALGEPLDLTRAPLLAQAAVADLATLLLGRVDLRDAAIQRLLGAFLTSSGPRSPSASSLGTAAQRASGQALQTRQDWEAALRAELGQDTASWLPGLVDQWAYRWFNIGSAEAANQAGIIAFQAVAVLDNRTSAFCAWVNGKVISMERVQRQIDRHVQAALAGDLDALMANWPLLSFPSTAGTPEFALAFEGVGLPPYHFRCRTRVVVLKLR